MKNFHFSFFFVFFIIILFAGCANVTDIGKINNAFTTPPSATSTTSSTPAPIIIDDSVPVTPIDNTKGTDISTAYTLVIIAKHNSQSDCWQVIDDKVYDMTKYIPQHPGGRNKIISWCGKDATKIFDLQHQPKTKKILPQYYIGDLQ